MVPLALMCGFRTVADAVGDGGMGAFTRRVMLEEIAPGVDAPEADRYARTVLDRFANPFIDHALWDITLYATAKMRVRVVPSIVSHAAREGRAPRLLALGFAAYLLFMRGDLQDARVARGGTVPADDDGARIRALWTGAASANVDDVHAHVSRAASADHALWGTDLTAVAGFVEQVSADLRALDDDDARSVLAAALAVERDADGLPLDGGAMGMTRRTSAAGGRARTDG
jgi:tagaturonate reductase